MRQRNLMIGALVLGALLCVAAGVFYLTRPPAAVRVAKESGRNIALATADLASRAQNWLQPMRCRKIRSHPTLTEPLTVGRRTFVAVGSRIVGGHPDGQLTIGAVADARGATDESLANARKVADAFRASRVDVVFVLGGMGATREEITTTLVMFLDDAAWLVVALPSDRESLWDFRDAVGALQKKGRALLDGTQFDVLNIDGVTIATLPGVPMDSSGRAHGLLAGNDGCVFVAEDLQQLAARLAREPRPRVLASHVPPRQRGPAGTDLGAGHVHMGNRQLRDMAMQSDLTAIVHGLTDRTGGLAVHDAWPDEAAPLRPGVWGKHVVVATGALEGAPKKHQNQPVVLGSAVLVEINGSLARVFSLSPSEQ